jgi:hypothetical protein
MSRTFYVPTVLLRCNKCRNQTPHLLISLVEEHKFWLALTYECQMCGEIKKAFDMNYLPDFTSELSKGTQKEENPESILIDSS